MNANVLKQYLLQRKKGYPASQSLDQAKTLIEFERLETLDLVQFAFDYEEDSYFNVFGWGCSCECASTIQKPCKHDKQTLDLIEREGLYYCFTQWRPNKNEEFEMADSCGMFIGMDASDYEYDLKQSAINEYLKYANVKTQVKLVKINSGFTVPIN